MSLMWVDRQVAAMLDLWEALVNIDSGSFDANLEGINRVCDIMAERLTRAGLQVTVIEYPKAGNSLVGVRPAKRADTVVLMGHMDTVFPRGEAKRRPFTVKNGIAYGPGVLDMKGGLVQLVYVLELLNHLGWQEKTVKVVLTGDEEIGHANSEAKALIMSECSGSLAVFNLESGKPDGAVVTRRKGVATYVLSVKGRAAHAGDPALGASAIHELAHKIVALDEFERLYPGVLVNVGVIGGGSAPSVLAAEATAELSMRFDDQKLGEKAIRALEKLVDGSFKSGVTCSLRGGMMFPPMERTPSVKELYQRVVRRAAEDLGISVPETASGGGSDAAFAVAAGARVFARWVLPGEEITVLRSLPM